MSIEEDDDLGAFFEDISAAEEEAKKEIVEQQPEDETSSTSVIKYNDTSNEINGHVVDYVEQQPEVGEQSAQGIADAVAVEILRGSVVVIKREAVITKQPTPSSTYYESSGRSSQLPPPPPPPPPLPQNYLYSNNTVGNPAYMMMHHQQQPPLPPGAYPTIMEQQQSEAATKANKKRIKRTAAGKTWEDPSLAEWPENDYRVFVGNLAKDVKNEQLFQHFHPKYPSVGLAKIVLDKNKNNISRGYGFVSFSDPLEAARAIREMNETFLGSRPIKVKKSEWMERDLNTVKKQKIKKH